MQGQSSKPEMPLNRANMLETQPEPESARLYVLPTVESRLIKQVREGQEPAFGQLYENYLPMVYGLCLRLTGNRAMAEEATQEVFIQVWRRIDTFRDDSSFKTWLHRLGTNCTISYLRRQLTWLQRVTGSADYEALAAGIEDSPAPDLDNLQLLLARLPIPLPVSM